jgi:hypothetical protein
VTRDGSTRTSPIRLFYEDNYQARARIEAVNGGPRVIRRCGGPEQPVWDDVQTYSPEWYCRFRAWQRAAKEPTS